MYCLLFIQPLLLIKQLTGSTLKMDSLIRFRWILRPRLLSDPIISLSPLFGARIKISWTSKSRSASLISLKLSTSNSCLLRYRDLLKMPRTEAIFVQENTNLQKLLIWSELISNFGHPAVPVLKVDGLLCTLLSLIAKLWCSVMLFQIFESSS